MKTLFAIKLDPSTNEGFYDAVDLQVKSANSSRKAKVSSGDSASPFTLGNALKILNGILVIVALCLLVFLVQDLINNNWSFSYIMSERVIVFYVFVGIVISAIALFIFNIKDSLLYRIVHKKKKKEEIAEERKDSEEVIETLNIDCFSFDYYDEKGKVRIVTNGKYSYYNIPVVCYIVKGVLHLKTYDVEYVLPVSEITKYSSIEKRIPIQKWNKKESVQSEDVRPYMASCAKNNLAVKTYYEFIIFHAGERISLLIPGYDAKKFGEFINLKM